MLEPLDTPDELWPLIAHIRAREALIKGVPNLALDAVALAAQTHVAPAGSLADDLLSAAIIESNLALGCGAAAREVLLDREPPGIFSVVAQAKVDLFWGLTEVARDRLGSALSDPNTSPAARDELALLLVVAHAAEGSSAPSDLVPALANAITFGRHRKLAYAVPPAIWGAIEHRLGRLARERSEQAFASIEAFAATSPLTALSEAERRVIRAFSGEAETIADAASELHLSRNTVKTHLASIYRKLGVSNRVGMMAALQHLDYFR